MNGTITERNYQHKDRRWTVACDGDGTWTVERTWLAASGDTVDLRWLAPAQSTLGNALAALTALTPPYAALTDPVAEAADALLTLACMARDQRENAIEARRNSAGFADDVREALAEAIQGYGWDWNDVNTVLGRLGLAALPSKWRVTWSETYNVRVYREAIVEADDKDTAMETAVEEATEAPAQEIIDAVRNGDWVISDDEPDDVEAEPADE